MPHIHTDPGQVDHTVTAYIIRTDGDEPRALLHMHKKLGRLLPVGGHIELDETPWAAIAHEVEEESGYRISDLKVMQPKLRIDGGENIVIHPQPILVNTHLIPDDHYHSDTAFLFTAAVDPSVELADGESSDLRWLTYDELHTLDNALIWPDTRKVYEKAIRHFLVEWEVVDTACYSTNISPR
jgi:8-oxo-dGTP pyrophosphatase MutT (NUDIX family)